MAATLPDVAVQFSVGGLQGVKQAFADFDRLLVRLGNIEGTHAQAGAQARVRAEQGANVAIEKTRKQLEREAERAAAKELREKDRASKLALRLAEREAKEKQRLQAQEAKATERAAQQKARAEEKAAREQVRAAERAAKEESRIHAQAAREQERQALAIARYRESVIRNSLRAEQTLRSQMEQATTAAIMSEQRKRERMARSAGGLVGGAVSRGIGMVGRVAGIAGGLLGGFSIASAMETGIQEQALAGELVRGSVSTGDFNRDKVVGQARAQAIDLGMSTTDILGGIGAFVRKTGDLQAMMGMLDEMSRLAAATGTAFEDMGSTGAEFFSQLKEIGQADKTIDVLRTLAGMGRAGAIDIKDLGQYGGRLASSAAMYDGDMVETMRSLGAAAQLARKLGGADVAEATLATQHIGGDVMRGEAQKHLAAYGINVWANKEHTRLISPEEIIVQSVSKTKGNLTALGEIFGERGIRAVRGAQVAYTRAGGGAAGEEAIRQQFLELKTTTLSKEDVDKNVADAMTEPGRKMQRAINEMSGAIIRDLLPLMPKLTEAVRALIPSFTKITEWLANNANWAGLGKIVAGAIVLEIAQAGIGKLAGIALEKVIMSMVGAKTAAAAATATAAETAGAAGAGVSAGTAGALGVAARAAGGAAIVGGAILAGKEINRGVLDAGADQIRQQAAAGRDINAVLSEAKKPISGAGGTEHARDVLAKLHGFQAAASAAEGRGFFGGMLAHGKAAGNAEAEQKLAQEELAARARPQIDAAVKVLTDALREAASKVADATDVVSRDDGLASQNSPARGPIQIGR